MCSPVRGEICAASRGMLARSLRTLFVPRGLDISRWQASPVRIGGIVHGELFYPILSPPDGSPSETTRKDLGGRLAPSDERSEH